VEQPTSIAVVPLYITYIYIPWLHNSRHHTSSSP